MKIAIGSDHAGYELKEHLRETLEAAGHEVADCGTQGTESSDYPDFATRVAGQVRTGRSERGILVCGTGIAMSMAANRVPGIRAANCNDLYTLKLARRHNDANVLTVGARVIAPAQAETIVEAFFDTPFEAGHHRRRIDKIEELAGSG